MKPIYHLLLSLVIMLFLFPYIGWSSLWVIVGGVLVDIDHYLWTLFRHRIFSVSKSFNFYTEKVKRKAVKEISECFLFFHLYEVMLLFVLLSFYSKNVLIFTVGLITHNITDIIHDFYAYGKQAVKRSIFEWIS